MCGGCKDLNGAKLLKLNSPKLEVSGSDSLDYLFFAVLHSPERVVCDLRVLWDSQLLLKQEEVVPGGLYLVWCGASILTFLEQDVSQQLLMSWTYYSYSTIAHFMFSCLWRWALYMQLIKNVAARLLMEQRWGDIEYGFLKSHCTMCLKIMASQFTLWIDLQLNLQYWSLHICN